jgi:hypothetical protein
MNAPPDPHIRLKWRVAIKREGPGRKLWIPKDCDVVCDKHFNSADFKEPVQSLTSVGGGQGASCSPRQFPLFSTTVAKTRKGHDLQSQSFRDSRRKVLFEYLGPVLAAEVLTTNEEGPDKTTSTQIECSGTDQESQTDEAKFRGPVMSIHKFKDDPKGN